MSGPRRGPGLLVFALVAPLLCLLALEDVGFRDSGELGTAAQILGVAHPTGFGIDLLALRLAALLPLGHIAWRQNLAVALEASAALALLAALCDRLARRVAIEGLSARYAGAALAVATLATWPTFIATAISVEVYSLALAAVLLAAHGVARGGRHASLVCVVVGFAPGLHVTAGAFAALILAGALLLAPERWRAWAHRLPLICAGALIVSYLPLASLRDPALDWGDPESAGSVLAHLSAARIRSAFHGEMLVSNAKAAAQVFAQLGEMWPALPFALVAIARCWRRWPRVVLAPVALLALDLAYACFVHPMGIEARQVGHVAGASLALLAGLGMAQLSAWLATRAPKLTWFGPLSAAALIGLALLRVPRAELRDGHAAAEWLGSAGPIATLPPRAVLLCWSDDACAAGLFASLVERVRPDLDIAPAQHLWDSTVRRRLEGLPAIAGFGLGRTEPDERSALNQLVMRSMLDAASPRPIFLESAAALRAAGIERPIAIDTHAPYLQLPLSDTQLPANAASRTAPVITAPLVTAAALARLGVMRAARCDPGEPHSEHARFIWSRAYGELGAAALGTPLAVEALRAAAELTPKRADAWTNLGVAFERVDDAPNAIAAAVAAIELDPQGATPWVNLIRLQLRHRDKRSAERTLQAAQRAGAEDLRLSELAAHLAAVH
jgi:tetratricopeptide (TPR) repeat protein